MLDFTAGMQILQFNHITILIVSECFQFLLIFYGFFFFCRKSDVLKETRELCDVDQECLGADFKDCEKYFLIIK